MDGEISLSTPRGQQLAHVHPFRGGGCMHGQLSQKNRIVAAESTKFRDNKGNEADVGGLLTPSEYFSNLAFSARHRAISGDMGL
jgi:hypothetical protein